MGPMLLVQGLGWDVPYLKTLENSSGDEPASWVFGVDPRCTSKTSKVWSFAAQKPGKKCPQKTSVISWDVL